jgi:hypothetical protein
VPGERGPPGHGSRHHGSVLQDPPGGWPADAPIRHLVGVVFVCLLYPVLAGVTAFRRYLRRYPICLGCEVKWLRVGCRLAFANLLNFAVWRKNPHANDVEPARDQKPLKGDDYGPTGPAGRPVRAAGQYVKVCSRPWIWVLNHCRLSPAVVTRPTCRPGCAGPEAV